MTPWLRIFKQGPDISDSCRGGVASFEEALSDELLLPVVSRKSAVGGYLATAYYDSESLPPLLGRFPWEHLSQVKISLSQLSRNGFGCIVREVVRPGMS